MQRCVLQVARAYIKCMLESVEAVVASDVRACVCVCVCECMREWW